jgi:hypothetical protein
VGDDAVEHQQGAPADASPSRLSRALVAAAVLGVLGYMTFTAFGFGIEARRAPLVVGVPATVLAAFLLFREVRGTEGRSAAEESLTTTPGAADLSESLNLGADVPEAEGTSVPNVPSPPTSAPSTEQLSTWGAMLWIAGLSALFLATGFLWTTLLFPPIFMWFYGRERWTVIAITTIGVFAVTYLFFIVVLQIQVYRGFLGLPDLEQLLF